ncbi:(Fe-S)-binding protein [Maridesulfovibrio sp.]|uniref:(Fe-S)-binding protein n=1 Tax=Maridesulfovibrio sp. TaxID=2795000 RepID=UPI002A18E31B|nr:(Fe-S)-binding protein [Maridesulfovibrio sp.]
MPDSFTKEDELTRALQQTAEICIECGKCAVACLFLKNNGSPAEIAQKALSSQEGAEQASVLAYDCSCCGLCSAVCPVDARPAEIFSLLREKAQQTGSFDLKRYSPLLGYERTGSRFPFRDSIIPEGCTTAFFPGCTLPALFPQAVLNTMAILKSHDPTVGLVLECCSKPSKMLGLTEKHNSALSELVRNMQEKGIKRVLSGCSNCHVTLKEFDPPFEVVSIYEQLASMDIPAVPPYLKEITVHDPCVTRFEKSIHEAVRLLLRKAGINVSEMKHCGEKTICCGEGGATGFHKPEYSKAWSGKRIEEARKTGLPMATYCAGCVNYLSPNHPTAHILDLLTVERKDIPRLPGFPINYINRLKLRLEARMVRPA